MKKNYHINFKKLIKLIKPDFEFQYLNKDEEKQLDKAYTLQNFENWFKENQNNLIWNKQEQRYNCSDNINISILNLTIIPIQFNKVNKDFYCYNNQLISLEGCPKEVGRDFYCYNNQLTNLKSSPKKVGKDFFCYNNKLKFTEK